MAHTASVTEVPIPAGIRGFKLPRGTARGGLRPCWTSRTAESPDRGGATRGGGFGGAGGVSLAAQAAGEGLRDPLAIRARGSPSGEASGGVERNSRRRGGRGGKRGGCGERRTLKWSFALGDFLFSTLDVEQCWTFAARGGTRMFLWTELRREARSHGAGAQGSRMVRWGKFLRKVSTIQVIRLRGVRASTVGGGAGRVIADAAGMAEHGERAGRFPEGRETRISWAETAPSRSFPGRKPMDLRRQAGTET